MPNTPDAAALLAADFAFFTNYTGSPTRQTDYAAKLANLTKPPRRLGDFLLIFGGFLAAARRQTPVATTCAPLPPLLTATFPKAKLIRTARFFQQANCRNLKICFGLDDCLFPQLLVSGAFHTLGPQPASPGQVDAVFRVNSSALKNARPTQYFKLNFGQRISHTKAGSYLNRFKQFLTHDQQLHGYVLDIDTFLLFLTNKTYLGAARDITIRFGMNDDGAELAPGTRSRRVQIMMLEFQDALQPSTSKPFYMCNLTVKNDSEHDPTACPPRQPCDTSETT